MATASPHWQRVGCSRTTTDMTERETHGHSVAVDKLSSRLAAAAWCSAIKASCSINRCVPQPCSLVIKQQCIPQAWQPSHSTCHTSPQDVPCGIQQIRSGCPRVSSRIGMHVINSHHIGSDGFICRFATRVHKQNGTHTVLVHVRCSARSKYLLPSRHQRSQPSSLPRIQSTAATTSILHIEA
jgi:hypothetical protein